MYLTLEKQRRFLPKPGVTNDGGQRGLPGRGDIQLILVTNPNIVRKEGMQREKIQHHLQRHRSLIELSILGYLVSHEVVGEGIRIECGKGGGD